MNKILFAISLARKSGKVSMGFDMVKERIEKNRAKVVVLAADTSRRTGENIKRLTGSKVPLYTVGLTQYDLSTVCGRLTGVISVNDENLAVLLSGSIKQTEGE